MPSLPRLQLGEIHEQPWCPTVIRDGAMDCLEIIAATARQYDRVAPLLAEGLSHSGAQRIVDLCSGGGGPWWRLAPRLANQIDAVLLTDLYPNKRWPQLARRIPTIQVWPEPVDATRVPPSLTGFRTLFTAFHHFAPEQARALLQDALDQGQGIALFEQTRRSFLALLVMLSLPWIALLTVPFISPWRGSRLFWTYLVPVIPVVLLVDGIISCLRSYTEAELTHLVAGLEPPPDAPARPAYHWKIGWVSSPLSPIGVTYVVGYPSQGERDGTGTGPRVARTA